MIDEIGLTMRQVQYQKLTATIPNGPDPQDVFNHMAAK
jgi:hypothetical protein